MSGNRIGIPGWILDAVLLATLLALSFYAVLLSGERGFFPLDQSIVFDGGYRLLSGQTPYRDFLIPIGPVVFWIQAMFFELMGIGYFSYVFGAAVVNVLATACSVAVLRLLFPASKPLSYVAGLLTAVWFYAPFGTPWPEQTAFFFAFVALALVLRCSLASTAVDLSPAGAGFKPAPAELSPDRLQRSARGLNRGARVSPLSQRERARACPERSEGVRAGPGPKIRQITVCSKPRSMASQLLVLLAGVLTAVSFLSKQNVAVYVIPLFLALLVVGEVPDARAVLFRWIGFALGFAGAMVVFFAWLWSSADPKVFFQYALSQASGVGAGRLSADRLSTLESFILPGSSMTHSWIALMPVALAAAFVAAFALYFCVVNRSQVGDAWRRYVAASILCIYGALFPYAFIITAATSPENCLPFIGIVVGTGLGLAIHLFGVVSSAAHMERGALALPRRRTARVMLGVGLFLVVFYPFALGVQVSLTREVHHVFYEAGFPRYLDVDKLEGLRWGQPTRMRRADVRGDAAVSIDEADFVGVYTYLKAEKRNFFVFPDFTIFYALLGVPSPQPILWFHKGLTYPVTYDPDLDQRVVQSLESNDVEIVVIEEKSWYGTGNRLDDFPMLKSYVADDFAKVGQRGIFSIYKKK